jgi:8-oxo-dGTP pyrophosphatase MutT (NUDIX family)
MSYITIYFGDKPVFLCDEITPEINEYRHHPEAVFIDELSTAAINSLLHEIQKPQFHAGIIFGDDFKKLKTAFFKHFTLVKAAGGLVKNEKGEILLIFRRGKWDLPKGKSDDHESMEECAKREVQEETGLQKLKAGKLIEITYHTYVEFGKHILKESYWYAMQASSDELLIPQTEEDITKIIWIKKDDLKKYTSNTFPAIERLLKQEAS